MNRSRRFLLGAVAAATVIAAACTESFAPLRQLQPSALADAYISTPAGYSELSSSFAPNGAPGPFAPNFDHGMGYGGLGGPGPMRGGGGLMGGGLGGPFIGDGIGAGFGRGPFGDGGLDADCTYSATTGIVTCPTVSHDGLSISRTAKYTTAAGQTQAKVDSTTNSVESHTTVSGTTTHGSNTSTVNNRSDQAVTGLAKGSAQRTVNGTSGGTENSTGTNRDGKAFTAARVFADTTAGLVLPAGTAGSPPPYPTAGRVARVVNATVTITGESPTTSSRKEVVTYDGTATAKVVVTHDGQTQNCTMPLPHGRLSCQ